MSMVKMTSSADDPKPQPDKFRDLARELGCDEDEAAFEDKVRRVAKGPPNDRADLERGLRHAEAERDAWRGKPGDRHKMADLLVQGFERQLREANAAPSAPEKPE